MGFAARAVHIDRHEKAMNAQGWTETYDGATELAAKNISK
jgi:hypothetical protein